MRLLDQLEEMIDVKSWPCQRPGGTLGSKLSPLFIPFIQDLNSTLSHIKPGDAPYV